RRGSYAPPAGVPEDSPGLEFAGEIAALGAGVSRWRLGDRVCGLIGGGAQSEYLTTHEELLATAPDSLGWPELAAIPEAFVTAADALWLQAGLAPSDRV